MVREARRPRNLAPDELAAKLDAEFIESRRATLAARLKVSRARTGPSARKFDIPVFEGKGVSQFDAREIKTLLDTKHILRTTYRRLHGIEVDPKDVEKVVAEKLVPTGNTRDAYLLRVTRNDAKEGGSEPFPLPPIVLKTSKFALHLPKGGTAQLMGYYADPDPSITPPIGGLWVSDDGEIVLTEDYVRGPTLEHVILKGGRKERAEREVVAQSLRFWKKTGGYAIRDPHPSNFKITEDSMKTDAPKVLLIDTGDVARQDPKTFTENFFQWYEVMPHLAGNIDYVPQKGDNVPETFSRASFIEGAVCALGERDGIAFLKEATKDASKDKRTLGLKKALDDYRATQKPIQK